MATTYLKRKKKKKDSAAFLLRLCQNLMKLKSNKELREPSFIRHQKNCSQQKEQNKRIGKYERWNKLTK